MSEDDTELSTELAWLRPNSFAVRWAIKHYGFGVFAFAADGEWVRCENECMGKPLVRRVLADALADVAPSKWPPLVREYGGLEAFLAACNPSDPW